MCIMFIIQGISLIPNHLAVSGDKSEVSSIQRAHFRKNGAFSSILTEVGMD